MTARRIPHRVETVIAGVLRGGVLASGALMLFGLVLSFAAHPEWLGSGPAPVGGETTTRLVDLPAGLAAMHGPAWVALGLLVLIATPVVRVGVAAVAFAAQRDWRFVAVALVVLALLATSFLLGNAA